jgi:hypothetical protein
LNLLGGGERVGELREGGGDGVEAPDQHQRVLPEALGPLGRRAALHRAEQTSRSVRRTVGMDGRVARTVAAAEEDTTRRRSSRMVSTRVRRPSQKRSSEEGLQSSRDAADSMGGEAERAGNG